MQVTKHVCRSALRMVNTPPPIRLFQLFTLLFLLEDMYVYSDHLDPLSSRESIYIKNFLSVDTLRKFYTVLEIFGKASVWLSTIELVFQSVFNVK